MKKIVKYISNFETKEINSTPISLKYILDFVISKPFKKILPRYNIRFVIYDDFDLPSLTFYDF